MDEHTWVSQEINPESPGDQQEKEFLDSLKQLQEEVFDLCLDVIIGNNEKPITLKKSRISSLQLPGSKDKRDTFFMAKGSSFFFINPFVRITGVYLPEAQSLFKLGASKFDLAQAKKLLTEILADPYPKK